MDADRLAMGDAGRHQQKFQGKLSMVVEGDRWFIMFANRSNLHAWPATL